MASRRSARSLGKGTVLLVAAAGLIGPGGCKPEAGVGPAEGVALAPPTREVLFRAASCDEEDPLASGRAAAEAVRAQLGSAPVKAVIVSECYEDRPRKAKVLAGVHSVFPKALVYGGATYGSFTQAGVAAGESVAVLAIAGRDVDVAAACQEKMGIAGLTLTEHKAELEKKLTAAGAALARKLPRTAGSRLMIVMADAHSPKNGPLVAGVRSVTGDAFPITGGAVNKNAGQTFVYFRGRMMSDSAIGLMLSGDFRIAMAGRQAKENDKVIATAYEAAGEALRRLGEAGCRPAAAVAFDCAGRKGKLKDVSEELAAIRRALGGEMPLFGTYNAGEIGPADLAEKTPGVHSSGVGWHVMVTVLGW
jgi:hypothetical protein